MKKPRLSKKATKFKRNISPVREIMNFANPDFLKGIGLEQNGLISFAGGWVNHGAPAELQKAYVDIVSNNDFFHKSGAYSPTLGMNEMKNAIIKLEEHLYNTQDIAPSEIAVGHSSTQLANDLLQVLLDPEDSILLLDPSYCNYPTQIFSGLSDINLLRFPVLNIDTWEYEAENKIQEFAQYILDKKPKVVLLIVPDNPTSKILSNDFVLSALNAVREIGSYLVIDFAYKELVFGNTLPEYFSWKPMDNYITLHSNSKWNRSLGRRLGWIKAPDFVVEGIESISNTSILCPDTLHQMAFSAYVNNAIGNNTLKEYVNATRNKYKAAAKKTTDAIKKHLNLPYLTPEGGLYTCVKVNRNSAMFVEDVLKATGVLFVPGWGFGRTVTEAVRISFGPLVNNLDKIEEGFMKVGEYLNDKNNSHDKRLYNKEIT